MLFREKKTRLNTTMQHYPKNEKQPHRFIASQQTSFLSFSPSF